MLLMALQFMQPWINLASTSMLIMYLEDICIILAYDVVYSKTDLLPGLEVHLLPHQAIGVAW